jgi:hypothetical protein
VYQADDEEYAKVFARQVPFLDVESNHFSMLKSLLDLAPVPKLSKSVVKVARNPTGSPHTQLSTLLAASIRYCCMVIYHYAPQLLETMLKSGLVRKLSGVRVMSVKDLIIRYQLGESMHIDLPGVVASFQDKTSCRILVDQAKYAGDGEAIDQLAIVFAGTNELMYQMALCVHKCCLAHLVSVADIPDDLQKPT